MSAWDISPSGVRGVLIAVGEQAEQFEGAFDEPTVTALFDGLVDVPAPGLGAAMTEYFEQEQTNITAIFNRVRACVYGASAVTTAYVAGDEQMLASTQNRAVTAASDGDFSTFEGQ